MVCLKNQTYVGLELFMFNLGLALLNPRFNYD